MDRPQSLGSTSHSRNVTANGSFTHYVKNDFLGEHLGELLKRQPVTPARAAQHREAESAGRSASPSDPRATSSGGRRFGRQFPISSTLSKDRTVRHQSYSGSAKRTGGNSHSGFTTHPISPCDELFSSFILSSSWQQERRDCRTESVSDSIANDALAGPSPSASKANSFAFAGMPLAWSSLEHVDPFSATSFPNTNRDSLSVAEKTPSKPKMLQHTSGDILTSLQDDGSSRKSETSSRTDTGDVDDRSSCFESLGYGGRNPARGYMQWRNGSYGVSVQTGSTTPPLGSEEGSPSLKNRSWDLSSLPRCSGHRSTDGATSSDAAEGCSQQDVIARITTLNAQAKSPEGTVSKQLDTSDVDVAVSSDSHQPSQPDASALWQRFQDGCVIEPPEKDDSLANPDKQTCRLKTNVETQMSAHPLTRPTAECVHDSPRSSRFTSMVTTRSAVHLNRQGTVAMLGTHRKRSSATASEHGFFPETGSLQSSTLEGRSRLAVQESLPARGIEMLVRKGNDERTFVFVSREAAPRAQTST